MHKQLFTVLTIDQNFSISIQTYTRAPLVNVYASKVTQSQWVPMYMDMHTRDTLAKMSAIMQG